MKDLRELRLWHYRRGLYARQKANDASRHIASWEQVHPGHRCRAGRNDFYQFDRRASFHESCVAVLDAVVDGDAATDHALTPLPKAGAQPR